MTVTGWFVFGLFAAIIGVLVAIIVYESCSKKTQIISVVIGCALALLALIGLLWYFNNTASGQRAMADQYSDFHGGLNRIVTVYTADGEVIATYEGNIDLEANDGGYVKFDFEGKRYVYYNCFIESIAEL